MATILGKTKMIIVLVLVETTFITSCISQNGIDDEKECNDMYVPVKNLEDCVDELFCKGHLTRLAVVAEYNFEKMGTKTSCVDIPVCSSVDIGAKELLKIDVAELLRSINCHTLYLNCNGVIPCNLGNVQNVQRITVNLEIAKP